MSIKLSQANMLKYFWEEKGGFTRHTSYDEVETMLKKEYPMLFEGLKRIDEGHDMVQYTLDKIIEDSEDDIYGDD